MTQKKEYKQWKNGVSRSEQKKSGNNFRSRYTTFNPTKEEKETIKNSQLDLGDCLDVLVSFLSANLTLSLKYHQTSESYCLTLRENAEDWTQARALSCWHSDYLRTIQMMTFALDNRFRSFPNLEDALEPMDTDW